MADKQEPEKWSDAEIAKRRDEVIRRMANTPPTPKGKKDDDTGEKPRKPKPKHGPSI